MALALRLTSSLNWPLMQSPIRDTHSQDRAIRQQKSVWRPALLILAGMGLLLLMGILAKSWSRQLATDRNVARESLRLAPVMRGDVRREFSAEGTLVVASSPTLYSTAEGIVTYRVKAGDAVAQGDLLLSIDSPSLSSEQVRAQAALGQLQAELTRLVLTLKQTTIADVQALEKSQLQLRTSQRNFARFQQGFNEHFVSRLEFEKAEETLQLAQLVARQLPETQRLNRNIVQAQMEGLRLQLASQQAVVDELQRRLEGLNLRSPVTGQVGSLALKQQAAVSQFAPLITVVDLSRFEAVVSVAESYAKELLTGMPVSLSLQEGQSQAGQIVAIAPEVNAGQINLRLGFSQGQPANLRQNQRVSAQILLERKPQVLFLPNGLYLDADHGRSLFVVRGNTAERVPVALGARGLRQVEIQQGLVEGDEVIVSDTSDLRDMKRLYITD